MTANLHWTVDTPYFIKPYNYAYELGPIIVFIPTADEESEVRALVQVTQLEGQSVPRLKSQAAT